MDKKKQDYLVKTLICQFIISGLIFGLLYFSNYFNLSFFNNFKKVFSNELKNNISIEDAETAFKEFNSENNDLEFIFTDYSEEKISAKISGQGGEDIIVNGEKINGASISEYTLNYNIIKPVKNYNITSEFGERIHPVTSEYSFHKGIDLATKENSEIYAALDGKVIEVGNDKWNGNYIKIMHENDIMTVYCHCNKITAKENAVIRGGEIIGLVGSTGQSTGPHLHFEIRINNICYNPIYSLKGAENAVKI